MGSLRFDRLPISTERLVRGRLVKPLKHAMDEVTETSLVAAARQRLSARGNAPINRQVHDQIIPRMVARPATFDSTSARTAGLAKDQRLQSSSRALASATTPGDAFSSIRTNYSDH